MIVVSCDNSRPLQYWEEKQCQSHNCITEVIEIYRKIHNVILLTGNKLPENEPQYAICCDNVILQNNQRRAIKVHNSC